MYQEKTDLRGELFLLDKLLAPGRQSTDFLFELRVFFFAVLDGVRGSFYLGLELFNRVIQHLGMGKCLLAHIGRRVDIS